MFSLFNRRKPDPSAAARELGRLGNASRAAKQRELVRVTTNLMRADLRAKGRSDMTEINWSEINAGS